MPNSIEPSVPKPDKDWISDHISDADGQINLLQQLVKSGESRLSVDLSNYLSLHLYLRELLETLRETQALSAQRQKNADLLAQVVALKTWDSSPKRPVGRPRKVTLARLLSFGTDHARETVKAAKGGAPRKYSDEFMQTLNEATEKTISNVRNLGKSLPIKVALAKYLDEFAKSRVPDERERKRRVAKIVHEWYKPLMKYRVSAGKRLRQKSQNPPKNSPNFEPLLRLMKP
jgi:hypothetical protein